MRPAAPCVVLVAGLLVVGNGCSLIESFDGYTGGSGDASLSDDASPQGDDGSDALATSDGDDTATSPDAAPLGHVYALGGLFTDPGGSLAYFSEVLVAPVQVDGTLGAWVAGTALPNVVADMAVVETSGFLYALGGDGDNRFFVTDVLFSAQSANGQLGNWTSSSVLPAERSGPSGAAINGFLLAMGGEDDQFNPHSEVFRAPVQSGGGAGAWQPTTPLPIARFEQAGASNPPWVYVLGGQSVDNTGGSIALGDVLGGQVDANGNIASWQSFTAFAGARSAASAVYAGGHIYLFGGVDVTGKELSDVQLAAVNGDGSLGSWSPTTSIPNPRFGLASATIAGYVYVMGGQTTGNVYFDDVEYAHVNADGTLGAWAATTRLPSPRAFLGAAAF